MVDKEKRSKESILYFEQVINSQEYKTIQKWFDRSGCNNTSLIGPVALIFHEARADFFCDWVDYYKDTVFYARLPEAAMILYNFLIKKDLRFSKETVLSCLEALVFYQTWRGCSMENKVANVLGDENFKCVFPKTSEVDLVLQVDFMLAYDEEWIAGVQVKPKSYARMNTDIRDSHRLFEKNYKIPVYVVYYDSNYHKIDYETLKPIFLLKDEVLGKVN